MYCAIGFTRQPLIYYLLSVFNVARMSHTSMRRCNSTRTTCCTSSGSSNVSLAYDLHISVGKVCFIGNRQPRVLIMKDSSHGASTTARLALSHIRKSSLHPVLIHDVRLLWIKLSFCLIFLPFWEQFGTVVIGHPSSLWIIVLIGP